MRDAAQNAAGYQAKGGGCYLLKSELGSRVCDLEEETNFYQKRKEPLGYGQGQNPVVKARGVTKAERSLQRLAERSFLSLWSYPNLFIDKGGSKNKGQEFCDLLVVFDLHVLIFSDKDIKYPRIGNRDVAWKRWFKKAVMKSSNQVYGAERWLKQYPDRIYLDQACTQPFPLDLPSPDEVIVHRIVVAHGASEWCKRELGGTGSLMIAPSVIAEAHYDLTPPMRPFTIGQINPEKGFVHVFDDTTLDVVMETLDTITDFTNYLMRKERFIESGKLTFAAGEDDLLAFYLRELNDDGEHDCVAGEEFDSILIEEGFWEKFSHHPQRLAQIEADKPSYFWDELIEGFSKNILADTQYYTSRPGVRHSEQIFRFMAKEPRIRRRLLAKSLLEFALKTPANYKAARVMKPSRPGDPFYVFVLLPSLYAKTPEEYREVRYKLLEAYCFVTKLSFPEALDIVGIATESGNPGGSGEDALYFDAREWTPELEAEAKSLQADLGLLTNVTMFSGKEKEYPDTQPLEKRDPSVWPLMKGRHRNAPCPCGSGKKYKHCCGKRRAV